MKQKLSILMSVTMLSACVTINIYFPAAAAEKAADKIIDDVWQLKDGTQSPSTQSSGTPATKPAESTAK